MRSTAKQPASRRPRPRDPIPRVMQPSPHLPDVSSHTTIKRLRGDTAARRVRPIERKAAHYREGLGRSRHGACSRRALATPSSAEHDSTGTRERGPQGASAPSRPSTLSARSFLQNSTSGASAVSLCASAPGASLPCAFVHGISASEPLRHAAGVPGVSVRPTRRV
jgi:hypothetical protein